MDIETYLKEHPEWEKYPDLLIAPPEWEEIVSAFPDAERSVLAGSCNEPGAYGCTKGALYLRMRLEGQSHKFAEMVACQRGPVLSTDDTFFAGSKPLYEQFGSQKALDRTLEASKRMGFVPNKNAVYFPNLARYKGDPEAYVTRAQGRGYIKKLLEKRGWACDGGVSVAAREPEHDPHDTKGHKRLGEDIIRERAASMIKADPSLKRVNRKELRERIIAKHGAT